MPRRSVRSLVAEKGHAELIGEGNRGVPVVGCGGHQRPRRREGDDEVTEVPAVGPDGTPMFVESERKLP